MAGMKRSYDVPDPNEDLFVDDLDVAARYAMATGPLPSSSTDMNLTEDQDEIDLEDSLSADNHIDDVLDNAGENIASEMQSSEAADRGDVDDDDESDVDLEEQLRQMVDVEEETPVSTSTDSRPRTAHEIDPYSSGQDALDFLFDVSDEEKRRLKNLTRHHLKIAGTVRHLLPSERTVVIQSKPGEAVLEEGTILVVCTTSADENSSESKIIPIGRVLEVFGPVSQPLYSVRLPEPLPAETVEAGDMKDGQIVTKEYDPWAETGDFTNLLRRDTNAFPIFYVPEGVRVINPALIMKASGRGSDASNFYDEEITNPNDLDYSDDEQERMAKRKGRPNKQGTDSAATGNLRNQYPTTAADHYSAPQGFHHDSQRGNQVPPMHNPVPPYPRDASRPSPSSQGVQVPSTEQEESDTVYF